MLDPTNAPLLAETGRYIEAARVAYQDDVTLSCNQRLVVAPSRFKIEMGNKQLDLVVAAPNDPRALPLITDVIMQIRSPKDVMIIAPAGLTNGREHTIPGIFSKAAQTFGLDIENPFVSIAKPELLKNAERHPDFVANSFTRANLIGGIVTNAAISDESNIQLDTLSGVQGLLKAWDDRFALTEILQGALELQDPQCPEVIYESCRSCITECIKSSDRLGMNTSPNNPAFIETVVQHAAAAHPTLSRSHILGYAVCSVSLRSVRTLPNYIRAILNASKAWAPVVDLKEIHSAVTDWLVMHQPDFQRLQRDNRKIAALITDVENRASASNLKRLFTQSQKDFFVGWCRPGDMRPFAKVLSDGSS